MSRRWRTSGVSGTDTWTLTVDPRFPRGWVWNTYPPRRLAYIGGASSWHGETLTRWGARQAAKRARQGELRHLARRQRRDALRIRGARP